MNSKRIHSKLFETYEKSISNFKIFGARQSSFEISRLNQLERDYFSLATEKGDVLGPPRDSSSASLRFCSFDTNACNQQLMLIATVSFLANSKETFGFSLTLAMQCFHESFVVVLLLASIKPKK